MPDRPTLRRIAVLSAIVLVARVATAMVVDQPGYTDSFYFTGVARRLAAGSGLTADFIWSPLEAHGWQLPVPSHLFWVPLPSALAAAGLALAGPLLGAFRAAQLPFLLVAAALPALIHAASRRVGASERASLAAAALGGLGGVFAPGLVAVDAFAPAAILGTAFFLAYGRAAQGSVRAGLLGGLCVGLLYLTRTEGALFGLALLALARAGAARRAALGGTLVALAIGCAWYARDLGAGAGVDVFARSALLVRYEDFFAIVPAYLDLQAVPLPAFLGAKMAALGTNAVTFAFAFGLLPVIALVAGVRALRGRADVRAWAGLAVLVYLVQSLVFTLHSTRGSYFHALAAFFPYGVAVTAYGAERILAGRSRQAVAAWGWGTALLVAAISAGAVVQWDSAFNGGRRARDAAVAAIPPGPFLAIDAAAWRWIADRPVAVAPADGLGYAGCVAVRTNARALVLEAAHFSRYEQLYTDDVRPSWLDAPIVRGATKIYPIRGEPPCAGLP